MRVIINASPLIVLFKSGLEELLPELCDEVMDAGLWLSDGVVDLLKKQAGE